MPNPYNLPFGSHDGPCSTGFAITNNVTFADNAKCIYVGVTGDVELITPDGVTLMFKNAQAGSVIPWAAQKVTTNTTATDLIGGR